MTRSRFAAAAALGQIRRCRHRLSITPESEAWNSIALSTDHQDDMIAAVGRRQPATIVVLRKGSAVNMPLDD